MRYDYIAVVIQADKSTYILRAGTLAELKTRIKAETVNNGSVFHVYETKGVNIKKVGKATFISELSWTGKLLKS